MAGARSSMPRSKLATLGKAQAALSRRGRETFSFRFDVEIGNVAGLEALEGSAVAVQASGASLHARSRVHPGRPPPRGRADPFRSDPRR